MKMIQRLAIVAVALALVAAFAFGGYSYQLKRKADETVRVSFDLSQKGRPTVQELRQRFGSALKQPAPCIAYGCGYQILLSNRVLAKFRLVPYTVLRSYFWARNGVIEENSLEFWTIGSEGSMVLSYVDLKYCERCDYFTLNPWSDTAWLRTTGSIDIGNASTAANKRVALALDTGCLTRFRGCTNIAELFPTVWQLTSARVISCRIPNHEGVIIDNR
jgi:hypothetical protein